MMAYAVGDVVCWVLSTTAGESFFMGHPKAGSILVLLGVAGVFRERRGLANH